MRPRTLPALAAFVVSLFAGAPALAGPCENLVLNLGGLVGATVTGAVSVPGPAYTRPTAPPTPACRRSAR